MLCVIPARAGSKRIPRKNARVLGGLPLIVHTIRAAALSGVFSEIIVSTDDQEIAALAQQEQVTLDWRKAELASDTATAAQVVLEYLERPENLHRFQQVALLLPTCPFRTAQHIVEADALFKEQKAKFLVAVTELDFPVAQALQVTEDGRMKKAFPDLFSSTRSQDYPRHYRPNGALYFADVPALQTQRSFFNEPFVPYYMSALDSFDLDFEWQFHLADLMASNPSMFRK